jgi:hypothetical protein
MIQCSQCEYYRRDEQGRISFACDPFSTIKEPECLSKWQLIKTDMMLRAYQSTLAGQRRMAPIQEKLLKMVEREMEDYEESESWKYDDEDEQDPPGDPLGPTW